MRWLLLLSVSLLAACGFQLRGSSEALSAYQNVQIVSLASQTDAYQALQRAFERSDIDVVNRSSEADIRLVVDGSRLKQTRLTTASDGTVREYELLAELSYRFEALSDSEPRSLLNSTSYRVWFNDTDNVLSQEEQRARLVDALWAEVADDVLRRLAYAPTP